MRLLALLPFLLALGCGDPFGDVGPGYGVTPGGFQDIEYARTIIEEGGVPPAESITVEGLFSENDLPNTGEPCDSILCSRPSAGVARSLETGADETWVQLGMSTGLSDTLRVPPLDLVMLIDRSAAMSIDMEETETAVHGLIDHLRPDDRLAVLAFNGDVETLHELTTVTDPEGLKADVRALRARGSADLMQGMRASFDMIRAVENDPSRLRRVLVLSCGIPNVGSTAPQSFQAEVGRAAADDIGFTFLGVLLGYNVQLVDVMNHAHGGNAFYLSSLAQTETVFDEDFAQMVTPLAYDLDFGLDVAEGWEVDRVYGVPADETGVARSRIAVSTVFPSKRNGGILVRLRRTETATDTIGAVSLDYEPEQAHGVDGPLEPARDLVAEEPTVGLRRSVALANTADQLRSALENESRVLARETLEGLIAYLEVEAAADPELEDELALTRQLLDNMR